ncbi:MAG: T9SS type A sorting domain-containing protein [Bacteroidia bacterium]
MKSKFLLSILFLAFSSLQAQTNCNAVWLRHTCGYTDGINLLGGNVFGDAVCADPFGNSYNSGYFSGNWFTMDTVIEMNSNRFYINKYNSNGLRIWTAKAKGTTINSIMSSSRMECDSLGNVYICGIFSVDDSVYLAPNWYPVGSGYIAKYDSSGNNVWCQYIPKTSTTSVSFTDMSIANGNLFACGIMNFGTISFGTFNLTSTQPQNGIITKLDLNGNVLQAEFLDPNSTNEVYGIEVSKYSNNVYLVGQHLNSSLNVDGFNLPIIPDATNSFIIKMNNTLTAQWARSGYTHIPTSGSGVWPTHEKCLTEIELDKLDNIYSIANGNGDTTRFGSLSFIHPHDASYWGWGDVYLLKYDANGNEQWLRFGSSPENDFVSDLITDEWGNSTFAAITGYQTSRYFVFGTDSIDRYHGGIIKYDPNGNVILTKQLQEARVLKRLALGIDSTFFGTGGGGLAYAFPYDTLTISECEDTLHAQSSVNYKMVMVKFFDNTSIVTSSNTNHEIEPLVLMAYPNPLSSITTLEFSLSENINVSVEIFDVIGRNVKNITAQNYSAGKNSISIDLSDLNSGIYFCKINLNANLQTIKLIKR